MAESNAHTPQKAQIKSPPPDETEVTFKEIYPKFPELGQKGNQNRPITDEAERTKETHLSSKSKKKTHLESKGDLRIVRVGFGDDDQSDSDELTGGFDPLVSPKPAKGKKKGDKERREKERRDRSSEGNKNGDLESNGSSSSREFSATASSTEVEEAGSRRDQSLSSLDPSTKPKNPRSLTDQFHQLQIQKKEKNGFQNSNMKPSSHPRDVKKPPKPCPAEPWQDANMPHIFSNLPNLKDNANLWILRFEEIMVGRNPSVGIIKCLLFNLIGLEAMEYILKKAGLHRYEGTTVNDLEPFDLNRNQVWKALSDTFPTNTHPDGDLFEPLGQEEDPQFYVSRCYSAWRLHAGKKPNASGMDQFILRKEIAKGLPPAVRSKLADEVVLQSMGKVAFETHVAQQVALYRKKMHELETRRKRKEEGCWFCGKVGHWARDCRRPSAGRVRAGATFNQSGEYN